MKKIVLIEDDSDLFALVKYNLEKEGFAFAGSQTGRGAIELCRRERPDLIILDIMLPDSDGLEICKALRNHSELAQVPIIFLTARVSETDRILGLELGANDYIVKPFFIRELIARIKNQFRTPSAPSRSVRAGRSGTGSRQLPRDAERPRDCSNRHRIPLAGISDEPAGSGLQPRTAPGLGLGP